MPYRRISRAWIAIAGISALAIAAWIPRHWKGPPGESLSGPRLSPKLTQSDPRPPRTWPIESLPELSFDEALTLLSSEIESYRKAEAASKAGRSVRIEQVAARLGDMHEENLRKIARAAPYYESHSPGARERFEQFRATYDGRWQTLQKSLVGLRAGDGDASEEIQTLLIESGALRPPVPIPEAKDLPRRRLQAEPREPRLTYEEWQAPKKVGSAPRGEERGSIERLFGFQAAHAQEAEDDLAETPEVKFTAESAPEIQKLLDDEDLRGSPARIANWVRNHIEFVPIWGALQSSVTCLENRKGTAMDIASLTIALLRASGIHARYQAGTVRLPIDEAKNWLGNFESAIAASSLLQSGGIPAAVQVDGSGQAVALRFEHVWVRAYVDYIPYQGACHVEGDTWVELDACVKAYRYIALPQLSDLLPEWSAEELVEGFFSTAVVDGETGAISTLNWAFFHEALGNVERAAEGAAARLLERVGPLSPNDVYGLGTILESEAPIVGAAPPFEVLARGWEHPELTGEQRFGIEIRLERGPRTLLSFELSASELGASRFSLFFRPDAGIDQRLLRDQMNAALLGPFLVAGVRLVPELRMNGEVVATGPSLDMGETLELVVDYLEPALATAPVRKRIVAGEATAIGIDLIAVPPGTQESILAEFPRLITWWETGDETWRPRDFGEALLSLVVHLWFTQVDGLSPWVASGLGCLNHRYPSVGFCSSKWTPDTLFGLPLTGVREGVAVDIPGDVGLLLSRKGDRARMAEVNLQLGLLGSGLEGWVPMEVFNAGRHPEPLESWIGSTTAMVAAMKIGDSLVEVTQQNADRVLQVLNLGIPEKEEIGEAVRQGLHVWTHRNSLRDGGRCLAGYVVHDTLTGNSIYRMSGGLCGGVASCAVQAAPNWVDDLMNSAGTDIYITFFQGPGEEFRQLLKKDFSVSGFSNAAIKLLQDVTKWVSRAERTAKQNGETSAFFSRAIRTFLLTAAYDVIRDSTEHLAQGTCETGEGCGYLPSIYMGWTFQLQLWALRWEINLTAAEAGIDIPCNCFCDPECEGGVSGNWQCETP